jgi:hypothetical protein
MKRWKLLCHVNAFYPENESGGKASWIKAILWNSKNINKVDPFAFRLVEQKAEWSMRFRLFSLDSLRLPPTIKPTIQPPTRAELAL